MGKEITFYISEIEKIPLLSLENEMALATKACSGNKNAQAELVKANLRFVVKIANQYRGYMDIEDLINEGNLGLMHAAEKFDPNNGNRFATYAAWWIRAYIQKAIRETSKGVRFPSTKYQEMKKDIWNFVSLDKTMKGTDDDNTSLGNLIKDEKFKTPEDICYENEIKHKLADVIKSLNEKQQTVIIKRYGLDGKESMSLSQLGTLMDLSKERIRQIEANAIKTLREILEKENWNFSQENMVA